jgi:hypothetical protein
VSSIAYGVIVECELALDDLPQSTEKTDVYIQVHRTQSLSPASGLLLNTFRAQDRTAHFFVDDDHVTIFIEGMFRFELWLEAGNIQCYCAQDAPDRLIRYWILQQMLPMFLVLAGTVDFLHGTATSTHSSAGVLDHSGFSASQPFDCIAFLGPSHVGKSTVLSHFLAQGHSLVTDDHLAISGEHPYQVLPAIPYHRPYRSIEDLGIVWKNYSPGATRLKRLYILEPARPDAPFGMDQLTGTEAIASLMVDNHYSLHDFRAPRFLPLVEKRFRRLADLSRQVPVIRLHVPRSIERLPELYDYILLDLASENYDQV